MDAFLIAVDFNKEAGSSEWKDSKGEFEEALSKLGFANELAPTTTYKLRTRKNVGTVQSELKNAIEPDDDLALCKADGRIRS